MLKEKRNATVLRGRFFFGKWKVESGKLKMENGKGRGVLGFLASLREGGGPLAVEGAREKFFR